jgi:hypothetical protein
VGWDSVDAHVQNIALDLGKVDEYAGDMDVHHVIFTKYVK